jgi:enoyl-CoA hydratase/carnithine racemase
MSDDPGKLVLPSPTRHIKAIKEGAIGWLILDKPVRLNAMSTDMWLAIPEILGRFSDDGDIRAVVVSSSTPAAFAAGADMSTAEDDETRQTHESEFRSAAGRAFEALHEFEKPLVAMIQGQCFGGGLSIATACDLRYASEGAEFSIPAARVGLTYPPEAIKRLIDLMGPAQTKEMFFSARTYEAHEVLEMGLVNRLHPTGDLEIYVRDMCKSIAQNAPLTVMSAKTSIDALLNGTNAILEQEIRKLVELCAASEDYTEGRKAMVERRRPRFSGR